MAKVSSCSFLCSGFSIPPGLDCSFVFVLLKGAGYLLYFLFFRFSPGHHRAAQPAADRGGRHGGAHMRCKLRVFALSCLIGYLLKL